jgi:hypothetical protein
MVVKAKLGKGIGRVAAAFLALSCLPAPASAAPMDAASVPAVEAVAYDYVDGQLEGDAARVARSLHPDLAKRAVAGDGPSKRELFPLRRMSSDELVGLTAQGALKTPRDKWQREVRVLDITGNAAVARVETPWFVDFFHLGRFGDRWLIVNALWVPKPIPATAAAPAGK